MGTLVPMASIGLDSLDCWYKKTEKHNDVLPKTASKAKKKTGYTGSWHPITPAQPPPPPRPHTPPETPQNGLLTTSCPQKTTKNGKKTPETEKNNFFLVPTVNPSIALVTGVCVTPA